MDQKDRHSEHMSEHMSSEPVSWDPERKQKQAHHAQVKELLVQRLIRKFKRNIFDLLRFTGVKQRKHSFEGVIYRECKGMSLRRSLAPTGPGMKEYDAYFQPPKGELQAAQHPFRSSLRIRCTQQRVYSDLMKDPRCWFIEEVESVIRPGMRVLEMGCGTGGSSHRLAELVGPSGGVISVHRDGESIRFARQRWRLNHLAFEIGWLETLDGELPGAFDAAIGVNIDQDIDNDLELSKLIVSFCKMVSDHGIVGVLFQESRDAAKPSKGLRRKLTKMGDRLVACGVEDLVTVRSDDHPDWSGIYGRVGGQDSQQDLKAKSFIDPKPLGG